MGFGSTEIILIVAVIVLFFGASKIPELARGVGEGMKEFRSASEKEIDKNKDEQKTTASSNEQHTDRKEVKQP